jgi:hypothetical protein
MRSFLLIYIIIIEAYIKALFNSENIKFLFIDTKVFFLLSYKSYTIQKLYHSKEN